MDVSKETQFLEMVEQNRQVIFKVCLLYSRDREMHSDLFQEVVVNLWSAWPRFRGEAKVSTWIYRIALNTCINFFRRDRRKPVVVPLNYRMQEIGEELTVGHENELYMLIERLGRIERALVLLYLEERSYGEIAEIMGISKANVGIKLFRIKEKLKEMSNE